MLFMNVIYDAVVEILSTRKNMTTSNWVPSKEYKQVHNFSCRLLNFEWGVYRTLKLMFYILKVIK